MKIVKAELSDIEAILDLIGGISNWLKAVKGIDQWSSPDSYEKLKGQIDSGDIHVLKSDDQQLAGMFILNGKRAPVWTDSVEALYLHKLAVNRSHAGSGLGRRLVESAELETRARGFLTLRLDCDSDSAVLCAYYESLGFRFVGIGHDARYDKNLAMFEKILKPGAQ